MGTPGSSGVRLTGRERQTLARICLGRNAKEIAAELEISHQTVDVRIYRMCQKIGVRDRMQLILWAEQNIDLVFVPDALLPRGLHPPGCSCNALYCRARRTPA